MPIFHAIIRRKEAGKDRKKERWRKREYWFKFILQVLIDEKFRSGREVGVKLE